MFMKPLQTFCYIFSLSNVNRNISFFCTEEKSQCYKTRDTDLHCLQWLGHWPPSILLHLSVAKDKVVSWIWSEGCSTLGNCAIFMLLFPLHPRLYRPDVNLSTGISIQWYFLSYILLNHCFSQETELVSCALYKWSGAGRICHTEFQWSFRRWTLFNILISLCTFFSSNI